ncbi:MAG: flagellar hook-length control protein FliK [Marivita sp.]|uniref:flagellar hook-length control protein FliK n=1 Tax=Marivita sp. TaxID=2003365 RepID=UPI003EF37264
MHVNTNIADSRKKELAIAPTLNTNQLGVSADAFSLIIRLNSDDSHKNHKSIPEFEAIDENLRISTSNELFNGSIDLTTPPNKIESEPHYSSNQEYVDADDTLVEDETSYNYKLTLLLTSTSSNSSLTSQSRLPDEEIHLDEAPQKDSNKTPLSEEKSLTIKSFENERTQPSLRNLSGGHKEALSFSPLMQLTYALSQKNSQTSLVPASQLIKNNLPQETPSVRSIPEFEIWPDHDEKFGPQISYSGNNLNSEVYKSSKTPTAEILSSFHVSDSIGTSNNPKTSLGISKHEADLAPKMRIRNPDPLIHQLDQLQRLQFEAPKIQINSVRSYISERTDDVFDQEISWRSENANTPSVPLHASTANGKLLISPDLNSQNPRPTLPIHIEPKDSGDSIDISMRVKDAELDISFSTKNRDAFDLLSKYQDDLKNTLKRSGVDEYSLTFDMNDGDQRQSKNSSSHKSEMETNLSVKEVEYQLFSGANGIDLRV